MLSSTTFATPWESMTLVGQGKLKVLFWDIYEAKLFTPTGEYQEQQYPLALELTYLRKFKKADLISETKNQWEKQGYEEHPRMKVWLDQLDQHWIDVSKKDQICLYIDELGNSHFYINGDFTGKIIDPEFSKAFAAIWLSEKTTEPEIRKLLIAGVPNNA